MIIIQRRYLGKTAAHCGGEKYLRWHDWKSFDTKFEALHELKQRARPREHRRWEYRLKPMRQLTGAMDGNDRALRSGP